MRALLLNLLLCAVAQIGLARQPTFEDIRKLELADRSRFFLHYAYVDPSLERDLAEVTVRGTINIASSDLNFATVKAVAGTARQLQDTLARGFSCYELMVDGDAGLDRKQTDVVEHWCRMCLQYGIPYRVLLSTKDDGAELIHCNVAALREGGFRVEIRKWESIRLSGYGLLREVSLPQLLDWYQPKDEQGYARRFDAEITISRDALAGDGLTSFTASSRC